jgi:hypothetical protein
MSKTKMLALVKSIAKLGPSLGGSLTRVMRSCGKKTCRCARDPEARHPALLLTWNEEGVAKSAHVSASIAAEVQSWIQARKQLKELLKEMDQAALEEIRGARAQKARKSNGAAARPKKADSPPE